MTGAGDGPAWRLDHIRGDRFQLVNPGPDTARNVRVGVEPAGQVRLDMAPREFPVFEPGNVASMLLGAGWGAGRAVLVVTWDGPDGQRRLQQLPIS